MGIEWLEESTRESNELPWIKDLIDEGGTGDIPLVVQSIYYCTKGLLVITEQWKGFVYANSKTARLLTEALAVYISTGHKLPRLVTCANDSGKLQFGFDNDFVDAAWVKHGKEYAQMFEEDGDMPEEVLKRSAANPLIPPSLRNGNAGVNAPVEPLPKKGRKAP